MRGKALLVTHSIALAVTVWLLGYGPHSGGAERSSPSDQLPELRQALAVADAVHRTPPGTIVAFAGTFAPPGWLLCDGRFFDKSAVYKLGERTVVDPDWERVKDGVVAPEGKERLEGLWGALDHDRWGTGESKRQLPDLRGMFLRGAGSRDGDFAAKNAFEVGESFKDSIGDHCHRHIAFILDSERAGTLTRIDVKEDEVSRVSGIATPDTGRLSSVNVLPTGGVIGQTPEMASETRPLGSAVNWIIKY
jgi:microcystin-dependent protein